MAQKFVLECHFHPRWTSSNSSFPQTSSTTCHNPISETNGSRETFTICTAMMNIKVSRLQSALNILHLLHHRNHNQHRQSAWLKWLSMLKRCGLKLMNELNEKNIKQSEARTLYMKDFLFPRCYL